MLLMRPRNETVRLQIENNELYATNTEKIQQLRQVKFEQLELKYKIQGQEVIKHLLSRIHGVILMKQIQCPSYIHWQRSCKTIKCCASHWRIVEEYCAKIPRFELEVLNRVYRIILFCLEDKDLKDYQLCCTKVLCQCPSGLHLINNLPF